MCRVGGLDKNVKGLHKWLLVLRKNPMDASYIARWYRVKYSNVIVIVTPSLLLLILSFFSTYLLSFSPSALHGSSLPSYIMELPIPNQDLIGNLKGTKTLMRLELHFNQVGTNGAMTQVMVLSGKMRRNEQLKLAVMTYSKNS